MTVKYTDAQESFGMCGPWLANCFLDDQKLKYKFLIDNFLVSMIKIILSLTDTEPQPRKILGLFTFTPNIRDFRIIIFDNSHNQFYQSRQSYEALYLQEIRDETIIIYKAFHNETEGFRSVAFLNLNEYEKILYTDMFEV